MPVIASSVVVRTTLLLVGSNVFMTFEAPLAKIFDGMVGRIGSGEC